METMDKLAQIVSHRREGSLGTEQYSYEWLGAGRVAELDEDIIRFHAGISRWLQPGDVLTLGALRLRVIAAEQNFSRCLHVMRDGWRARVQLAYCRLLRPTDLIYRRIIITL